MVVLSGQGGREGGEKTCGPWFQESSSKTGISVGSALIQHVTYRLGSVPMIDMAKIYVLTRHRAPQKNHDVLKSMKWHFG